MKTIIKILFFVAFIWAYATWDQHKRNVERLEAESKVEEQRRLDQMQLEIERMKGTKAMRDNALAAIEEQRNATEAAKKKWWQMSTPATSGPFAYPFTQATSGSLAHPASDTIVGVWVNPKNPKNFLKFDNSMAFSFDDEEGHSFAGWIYSVHGDEIECTSIAAGVRVKCKIENRQIVDQDGTHFVKLPTAE